MFSLNYFGLILWFLSWDINDKIQFDDEWHLFYVLNFGCFEETRTITAKWRVTLTIKDLHDGMLTTKYDQNIWIEAVHSRTHRVAAWWSSEDFKTMILNDFRSLRTKFIRRSYTEPIHLGNLTVSISMDYHKDIVIESECEKQVTLIFS